LAGGSSGSRIVIYREWNSILEQKLKKQILEMVHEERLKDRVLAAVRIAMVDSEAKRCGDAVSPPYREGLESRGLKPFGAVWCA
jgi:hypothetical protein